MSGADPFLFVVITAPGVIDGEADYLEGMLEAGLSRLHVRKPGASVEGLLERLAPRWAERLVVHGSADLAVRFGVSQLHGSVVLAEGSGRSGGGPAVDGDAGFVRSTSVHSWEEFGRLPSWLVYAFISPVFDSLSKKGYPANKGLLNRPVGALPCKPVALGGVGMETIGRLLEGGWTGAAALGWIWEEPRKAVSRFEQLKKIIDGQAKGIGGGGL